MRSIVVICTFLILNSASGQRSKCFTDTSEFIKSMIQDQEFDFNLYDGRKGLMFSIDETTMDPREEHLPEHLSIEKLAVISEKGVLNLTDPIPDTMGLDRSPGTYVKWIYNFPISPDQENFFASDNQYQVRLDIPQLELKLNENANKKLREQYQSIMTGRKFDDLTNKLFFGVLSHDPDTVVRGFLSKYFPFLLIKPSSEGKWTMYPPGELPALESTVHSLKFKKHPHFDFPFYEGQFDISSAETKEGIWGNVDYQISFRFLSKNQAEKAFQTIVKSFQNIGLSQKQKTGNDKKFVMLSYQSEYRFGMQIQFLLIPDEILTDGYKLFVKLGAFFP